MKVIFEDARDLKECLAGLPPAMRAAVIEWAKEQTERRQKHTALNMWMRGERPTRPKGEDHE